MAPQISGCSAAGNGSDGVAASGMEVDVKKATEGLTAKLDLDLCHHPTRSSSSVWPLRRPPPFQIPKLLGRAAINL
jgi:hypothetical protein